MPQDYKTHIWSDRLDHKEHRLTHCGMYRKMPGMLRNEGNTFEIADHTPSATCFLCREAVGLPKTVRFEVVSDPHSPAYNGALLQRDTMCYCPGDEKPWQNVPQCQFGVPLCSVEGSFEDWVRDVLAQCPGYHVLIVQHNNEPCFGVLRTIFKHFEHGEPYNPRFDFKFKAPEQRPSRYDILMED